MIMGCYVDLLQSVPPSDRDVAARVSEKTPEVVRVAKQFGREYFDGERRYGYGGYYYDGRWVDVARAAMRRYAAPEMVVLGTQCTWPAVQVLDVGCGKGFLVGDLVEDCRVGAYGIDASRYAVVECPHPPAVGRLHLGSADDLPFPDGSFDLVLSVNTLHNLPRDRLIRALREIRRVARPGGGMFVQVDSYRNSWERALFEAWVLTAETHGTPEFWLDLFDEAGYDGDYCWTFV